MQTVANFIGEHGLSMVSMSIDARPDAAGCESDWDCSASHWRCIVSRSGGHDLTVYYSQGSAHRLPPELADVLDCMASDASSVDNAASFEDWSEDLGYGADSRKGERIYRACVAQGLDLRRLLGNVAYDALLYDCERL